ncbi:MAG: TrmH family RNA methyltransferase [Bacteriovoracaceae bacterium]
MQKDLIIGIHGIIEALKNTDRNIYSIVATEEGLDELYKKSGLRPKNLPQDKIQLVSGHKLQEEAARIFQELDFEYQRVPSQIFLVASPLSVLDSGELVNQISQKEEWKILCLDQVTDVHNGAAILRTASFYGVDALVISSKNTFSLSPSFYRLASGAPEYVPVYRTSNLSKFVTQMKERGVMCVGFSEHATESVHEVELNSPKTCLIVGAEEVGISHAVLRNLEKVVALKTLGQIQSLNVSVASAIAMENLFRK